MRNAPDSAAILGNYDTSETAGGQAPYTRIERIAPVFDVARAHDLAWALRALDPADTEVSPNLVQTSPGLTVNRGDPSADADRVRAAAQAVHAQLRDMGYEIDAARGVVMPRDPTATLQWMSTGKSVGPLVTVDEQNDRSAG